MSATLPPAHEPPPPVTPAAALHLIIPFAHTGGDGEPPLAPLPDAATLPHLRQLLATATRHRLLRVPPDSLTPPHEWACAWAQGWRTGVAGLDAAPDGPPTPADNPSLVLPADRSLPWAAWDAAHLLPTPQTPAAWFTPCHQEIGAHHVSLLPPQALALSDDHSRALMAALAPLALEDGIHLRWVAADRWLATGNVLAGAQAASLDRVAGRSIGPWLHALPPLLRRLQSEAQMLFYTHPAHDERASAGQAPVNAFWVSGAGAAPAAPHTSSAPPPPTLVHSLRDAALAADGARWAQAWADTDRDVLHGWLAQAATGRTLHTHLCGEQGWLHITHSPTTVWQRMHLKISAIFSPHRLYSLASSL